MGEWIERRQSNLSLYFDHVYVLAPFLKVFHTITLVTDHFPGMTLHSLGRLSLFASPFLGLV